VPIAPLSLCPPAAIASALLGPQFPIADWLLHFRLLTASVIPGPRFPIPS
jgi:hypothetical protein